MRNSDGAKSFLAACCSGETYYINIRVKHHLYPELMTIYPTPSPEGIAKLQEFYRTERGLEVSDEQAYEILGGIMRFLYLTEIKPLSTEEESLPLAASPAASKTGEGNTPPLP